MNERVGGFFSSAFYLKTYLPLIGEEPITIEAEMVEDRF